MVNALRTGGFLVATAPKITSSASETTAMVWSSGFSRRGVNRTFSSLESMGFRVRRTRCQLKLELRTNPGSPMAAATTSAMNPTFENVRWCVIESDNADPVARIICSVSGEDVSRAIGTLSAT